MVSKRGVPPPAQAGLPADGAVQKGGYFREDLGRIACPVLVLCGERDRANRKAALELRAGIPGAEAAWIPGAGHEVNRDAPEALAEVLREFFGRVCAG